MVTSAKSWLPASYICKELASLRPSRQVGVAVVGHMVPSTFPLSLLEVLEEAPDLPGFLSETPWVTPLPSCFGSAQRLCLRSSLKDQMTWGGEKTKSDELWRTQRMRPGEDGSLRGQVPQQESCSSQG